MPKEIVLHRKLLFDNKFLDVYVNWCQNIYKSTKIIRKGSVIAAVEQSLVSISKLAQELLITPRTIRYYEEMGLLTPVHHEKMSQRLYGPRERARLTLILRGKRLGFSLAEIKEMIDLYDIDRTEGLQLERAVAYGEKRLQELDEKIRELTLLKGELLDYHQQFTELLRERNTEKRGG
ncbi:putative transcriptional regulator [Desulfosporosinus youngiae DSM 17734]|uniref:Putative transcriptional regulator n=1 Tax=Desulfosporosinus youngiae DSM 17734 TaxID=768710 RepID=H5XZR0_9FIRM|nr:putative transcriptional regulator [Desulfosporosinus youngiae DSM 17734]